MAEDYPAVAIHAYKRFIKLKPDKSLDYLDFLLRNDLLKEALSFYVDLLEMKELPFASKLKSRLELWLELSEFVAKYPSRAQSLKTPADTLIRYAIAKYPEEAGRLWIFLADYYSRLGYFGKARDVFEEALAQLTSVKDFGVIFNAYMKFEEAMLDS